MLQTHFELAGPIRLKHVTLFGCRVGGDEGDFDVVLVMVLLLDDSLTFQGLKASTASTPI